jgi:Ran GTPase-activating protein (RanGAP) involved in mRNA processing and transport
VASLHKSTENPFKVGLESNYSTEEVAKWQAVLEGLGMLHYGVLPWSVLGQLYFAKWNDLQLTPTPNQLNRFLEFCKNHIKGRDVKLRDCGIGQNAWKVFGNFLAKHEVVGLDLRKNKVGNAGILELAKGLQKNRTLVHLDLGSNDITQEGAEGFFDKIKCHKSLYSLNLANSDGLHRNRMGITGWKALNKVLKSGGVLAMLDIADNSIGNDGIKYLLKKVDPKKSNIVYINLSNNSLTNGAIPLLANLMNSSQLQEIRLSNNPLTDASAQELGYYFYRGQWQLEKLDLSNTNLTSCGLGILSHALKLNSHLTHLNLESNNFADTDKFYKITLLLKSNKILKSLNLSKCNLTEQHAEHLSEGLSENSGLLNLYLSKNKLMTKGAIEIFDSLVNEEWTLRLLDLSHNQLSDGSIPSLWRFIDSTSTLQKLNLSSNTFSELLGKPLCASMKKNWTILYLNASLNNLEKRYSQMLKSWCDRNIQNQESKGLPEIRQQLLELTHSEEGTKLSEDQLLRRVEQYKDERMQLEKEFYCTHDKFEAIKDQQISMYNVMVDNTKEVSQQLDLIEEEESRMEERTEEVRQRLDMEMEELLIQQRQIKEQQKEIRGTIQQHLDRIDIKTRDHQMAVYKQKRELERVQKKLLVKKLNYENLFQEVEELKASIERLEKEKQQWTISTAKKTRTTFHKSSKSINKTPWMSCSPNKKKKKAIENSCRNIKKVAIKHSETSIADKHVKMEEISLFGMLKKDSVGKEVRVSGVRIKKKIAE